MAYDTLSSAFIDAKDLAADRSQTLMDSISQAMRSGVSEEVVVTQLSSMIDDADLAYRDKFRLTVLDHALLSNYNFLAMRIADALEANTEISSTDKLKILRDGYMQSLRDAESHDSLMVNGYLSKMEARIEKGVSPEKVRLLEDQRDFALSRSYLDQKLHL